MAPDVADEDDDALVPDAEVETLDPDVEAVEALLDDAPRRPGRPELRQPPAPAGERGPSWWVGLDREALTTQATEKAEMMSRSKQARYVRGMVLASGDE